MILVVPHFSGVDVGTTETRWFLRFRFILKTLTIKIDLMVDFGNGLTDFSPWHHFCSSQPTGSPESCSPLYSHNTNKMNNAKCTWLYLTVHIVNWNICVFCDVYFLCHIMTTRRYFWLRRVTNHLTSETQTPIVVFEVQLSKYVWSSKHCYLFSGVLVSSYYQILLRHSFIGDTIYIQYKCIHWTIHLDKIQKNSSFLSGGPPLWVTKKNITCWYYCWYVILICFDMLRLRDLSKIIQCLLKLWFPYQYLAVARHPGRLQDTAWSLAC